MTSRRSIALTIACAALAGCSSSAPIAPIGLDKRPANSPETISALIASGDRTPALPATPPSATAPTSGGGGESPQAFDLSIILSDFSAPQGLASLPSGERLRLVEAAKSASLITLYCRGDRRTQSATASKAMLRRGVHVKRYLVAQGVDPARIRIFVRSTGGFVADNATLAGRAKNRRVEIRFS